MNMLKADLIFTNNSDLKSDFQQCLKFHSVTSTPKPVTGVQGRENHEKINHKKMTISESEAKQFLLESKEVWPLAFSEACQDYLNNLKLNIKGEILFQETKPRQGRGMTSKKSKRSNSRTRSLSPGGAQKMKDNKWEKYAEVAVDLIDNIIFKYKDLLERDLCLSDYNQSAKELIERLLKYASGEERARFISQNKCNLLMEALQVSLKKLGVLVPVVFSEQFLLLKVLLEKEGEKKILRQDNIAAVQTMLFNVTKSSRTVLRKLLTLYNILSKEKYRILSKGRLSHLLRPSLFEGDSAHDQLKLCCDFITLSDRLFNAPSGLVDSVRNKITSRINKGVYIPILEPEEQQTKIIKVKPLKHQDSSITIETFKKINSPERNIPETSPKVNKKRKSVTDIAKVICKRAMSPLRNQKDSYNIDKYFNQTKKAKAGDLYSM